MMAIIETIVSAVLGSILSYVKLWYDQGQAAENEWNAKTREAQLRSVKDADKMSLEIKNAKPIEVGSPSAWNAASLVFVVILLFSPGCALFTKYVHVPSKMPYIEAPVRPQIPTAPVVWTPREIMLKDYALDLEGKVKTYNDIAKRENIKNGYEDAPQP